MEDHRLTKASVPPRDDMVYRAMKIWTMDMKRMKYHHPAINLRLLPSHNATERLVVALDRAVPISKYYVVQLLCIRGGGYNIYLERA